MCVSGENLAVNKPPPLKQQQTYKKKIIRKHYLLSFEEGDVEDGGVEIHELEHEHFECQLVLVLRLCSMHF